METTELHFLKVSGTIRIGKHQEIQQTIRFIFNQLPQPCMKREIAIDVDNNNRYHIFMLWQTKAALMDFKSSNLYELLVGAFQTLGTYQEVNGHKAEAQLFDVSDVKV